MLMRRLIISIFNLLRVVTKNINTEVMHLHIYIYYHIRHEKHIQPSMYIKEHQK